MSRKPILDSIRAPPIIFLDGPLRILNFQVLQLALFIVFLDIYRSEISIWGINESFCWYVCDPGRPSRAIFKSEPMGNSADSYNLTWKIDSYAPIEEYKLMFRKLFVCPNYTVRFRFDFFL
jgi:hypothetical protein